MQRNLRMTFIQWAVLLLLAWVAMVGAAGNTRIGVLNFTNSCDFKTSKWEIEKDVPNFLIGHLKENKAAFIGFDTVQAVLGKYTKKQLADKDAATLSAIGKQLGATCLVLGDITHFSVEKKTAVMPDVGGYKQYAAELEIKLLFFDCDVSDVTYETVIKTALARRGLKFNPPGRISEDETDYLALESEPFGSEAFMRTVLGEAMLRLSQDFAGKVASYVNYGSDTLSAKQPAMLISEAKVLQIDGSDAFINAGRDDNIKNGDQFDVYTQGAAVIDSATGQTLGNSEVKVGKVKVAQVKAAHFSRVKVLDGEGKIKVMDIVRLR
jgi:hypothetical protein